MWHKKTQYAAFTAGLNIRIYICSVGLKRFKIQALLILTDCTKARAGQGPVTTFLTANTARALIDRRRMARMMSGLRALRLVVLDGAHSVVGGKVENL